MRVGLGGCLVLAVAGLCAGVFLGRASTSPRVYNVNRSLVAVGHGGSVVRFFSFGSSAHFSPTGKFDAVGFGKWIRVRSAADMERMMRQEGFSASQIQTFVDSAWYRPPVPLWSVTRGTG
jgi:hypothetical protein